MNFTRVSCGSVVRDVDLNLSTKTCGQLASADGCDGMEKNIQLEKPTIFAKSVFRQKNL